MSVRVPLVSIDRSRNVGTLARAIEVIFYYSVQMRIIDRFKCNEPISGRDSLSSIS
jgi:hypothetical protein